MRGRARAGRAAFEAAAKQGIERGMLARAVSLVPRLPAAPAIAAPPQSSPVVPPAPARSRLDRMTSVERRMMQLLEARKAAGEIRDFGFERVTLLLDEPGITGGKGCRYTPDFDVVHLEGAPEFIETKGPRVEEDARLKFRWAQAQYPHFRWTWARWLKGSWESATTPAR